MHHAVPQGTALYGATLRPPVLKSCRIILCIVQRKHIVGNRCDLLHFKCVKRLLSMQFIHHKSSWTFIVHSTTLHFLNPDTPLKNRIELNAINGRFLLGTMAHGVRFMSSNIVYIYFCLYVDQVHKDGYWLLSKRNFTERIHIVVRLYKTTFCMTL